MIGQSTAFCLIKALIAKIGPVDAPVLIEGETGTGKELAAREIHYGSARRNGPFVPVNCGAIPDGLVENELFGHRRGAFTDARADYVGLVGLARGGTLFLDEVDALTSKAQVTLLRFLQDQLFRPLGGHREEPADVRIVAAANRSLDRQVERGEFRLDLLYRLKLMCLTLPPLRERYGDVALLADHFVQMAAARYGKRAVPLHSSTLAWFERYSWPGNIRELENLVHREFLLAEGESVFIRAPASLAPASSCRPRLNYRQAKDQAIQAFEERFLATLLLETKGNISAAARISGTERRHLSRLLKKYRVPARESSST